MPEIQRLAYLTAGAAGMYCGSCIQDNALARELIAQGLECVLLPVYTPIRVDGENVSQSKVFLGGINVYLDQQVPFFSKLPGWMIRWLDRPWLLNFATKWAGGVDAASLGALAESVMKGVHGKQRRETIELCNWLANEVRPDAVILTNLLIGGCVPEIKRQLNVPVAVMLQGDDLFIDFLPQPYRDRCLTQLKVLASQVDVFITNTEFYATKMSKLFDVPRDRFRVLPLSIDAAKLFPISKPPRDVTLPPKIGYMARLAPEKGLHVLVDAFIKLRQTQEFDKAELHIAGWLGPQHRSYAEQQWQKLKLAGLGDAFTYHGSPDAETKRQFLLSLDVLSVPATIEEPKGLYVLEALAAGVPVVQPRHGAFTELLAEVAGGHLVSPHDSGALSDGLSHMLRDLDRAHELGVLGREHVQTHRSLRASAVRLREILAAV